VRLTAHGGEAAESLDSVNAIADYLCEACADCDDPKKALLRSEVTLGGTITMFGVEQ
jgi:hypothetical protein